MTTAAAVTVSMETTDMAAELANVTAATMYVYPAALSNFAATMACAFVVLGCLGNGTTIVALLASEKLRSHATTMFVISLAVTDFIYCVFNMPLTASRYIHMAWVHSDELCMIFPFLFYGNVAVSILNLLTITINRYVLICHTKTYQRIYRQPYIAFMIVASWLVPVVFLVPPLFGVWGRYGEKPQTSSCTILEDENGNSPKSAIFAVGIGVPMIVIVLCYLRIYWQVRRSSLTMQGHSDSASRTATTLSRQMSKPSKKRSEDEARLTKMMIIIFSSFTLCFFPLMVVNIVLDDDEVPPVHVITSVLAWASSVINPYIYAFHNVRYRQAYTQLFRGCPGVQARRQESSSSNTASNTRVTDTRVP